MLNSRDGTRYIKRRMVDELKQKILAYNEIVPLVELKKKPLILKFSRCNLVNATEKQILL
jgi:hypothetical protein